MVMDRDRTGFLRDILSNDILIEGSANFRRLGDPNSRRLPSGVLVQFLVEDAFTDIDATVANIDPGTGDQLAHLGVALPAERAHWEVRSPCHKSACFYAASIPRVYGVTRPPPQLHFGRLR